MQACRKDTYQAGTLGLLGLVLAVIGLYTVISYSVSQRTREIGIRLALGSDPRDVVRLILRQGATLVTAGVFVGLLLALVLGRVMAKFLVLVSATDAVTFAAVTGALAAVAFWACYVPARRAARVDPILALRHE